MSRYSDVTKGKCLNLTLGTTISASTSPSRRVQAKSPTVNIELHGACAMCEGGISHWAPFLYCPCIEQFSRGWNAQTALVEWGAEKRAEGLPLAFV
jgi:hypothetical protein